MVSGFVYIMQNMKRWNMSLLVEVTIEIVLLLDSLRCSLVGTKITNDVPRVHPKAITL